MEPLLYINGLYIDCKMNISCKDGLDKGQKWYRANRSRRY